MRQGLTVRPGILKLNVKVDVTLAVLGIAKLEKLTKKIGMARIRKVLESMRDAVTLFPVEFPGKMIWVTEKQRRYVMWAIKEGIITVPYQQTGTYRRSWKIKRTDKEAYSLYTMLDYAKWLAGDVYGSPQSQARIHQGRWAMVRPVFDKETATLEQDIERDIYSRADSIPGLTVVRNQ